MAFCQTVPPNSTLFGETPYSEIWYLIIMKSSWLYECGNTSTLTLIFVRLGLGEQTKKTKSRILIGNEKFALQKCLYFFSKTHGGQVISIFIFFSKYPFGGISYTLPLLGFRFLFFCLFTQTQPHKNQSDPNKIFVFFYFSIHLSGYLA